MKVEDQLSLILTKLEEQTKGVNEGNRRINDVQVSIDDLKVARDDFDHWRPQVDNKVADLSTTWILSVSKSMLSSPRPKLLHLFSTRDLFTPRRWGSLI
jgi:hypothetical protein